MSEFTNRFSDSNQSTSAYAEPTYFSNPTNSDKSEDAVPLVSGSKISSKRLNPSNNMLSSKSIKGLKLGSSMAPRSLNILKSNKDLNELGSRPVLTNAKLLNSDYLTPKNFSSKFQRKCSKFSKSSKDKKYFVLRPADEPYKSGVMRSFANKFSKIKMSSPSYAR